MTTAEKHKKLILDEALRLGFMGMYVAKAGKLEDDARRLEQWLSKGFQAGMSYMERNFDLRIDPTKLVPGAKTVLTFPFNYFPEQTQQPHAPKIARYAYGADYHDVIRAKLNALLEFIRTNIGVVEGRGFVDSAPVLERAWAVNSGFGWVGKNGNLINPKTGSYFFLSTLITDLELEPDLPFSTNHCGSCTRCIDACPTEAIVAPKVIDGNKCISYLTIELKDALIPKEMELQLDGWMFGCDVCQQVCPWNRFSKPHSHEELIPIPEILNFTQNDWEHLQEPEFKAIFKHSPLKRSKYSGIMRNVKVISKK